jgi:hypothetical protein
VHRLEQQLSVVVEVVLLEVEQVMEPEQLEEPEVASKMGEEPLQMTERNSEAMVQHLDVVAL